jgi:hypothetical protein
MEWCVSVRVSFYNGSAKSRWVFDVIASGFTIGRDNGCDGFLNSNLALVRWTEAKIGSLIEGWISLLDAIKGLKNPGK